MEINKIHNMDCLEGLKKLADNSIDCCVTSPPYYGLRNYGVSGQIGLEETPELFIDKMVLVFNEVNRVLKPTGTLWVNMGDSYASGSKDRNCHRVVHRSTLSGSKETQAQSLKQINKIVGDLKPKDLIGVPWMLAFALRNSGWYLRQDIIWSKPNPMPESVTDRCTKAHEYIFLLSKSNKYYFDAEAIKTKANSITTKMPDGWDSGKGSHGSFHVNGREKGEKIFPGRNPRPGIDTKGGNQSSEKGIPAMGLNGNGFKGHSGNYDPEGNLIGGGMANKRSVWTVTTKPFKEAHFATFPEDLIVDCIKAGCPENGIVLDPFMGGGTTALVARKLNRNFTGFELNPEYIKIAEHRLEKELGLFV
jgi:DNA modification methylase